MSSTKQSTTKVKREKKASTSTPSNTSTSNTTTDDASGNSKKRNRVPISCTICRRRKVKCDKRRPVCTACERTGVAHLCHYVDPPWAQPLTNTEINPVNKVSDETEQAEIIAKLKDKIKNLEKQLSQTQSEDDSNLNSPSANSHSSNDPNDLNNQRIDTIGSKSKNFNESLNLGKKFDMLHIKTTTTVHLGATSWLAIMKGDPYLRVLWAHIFKLRKQAEEVKFRKNNGSLQPNYIKGSSSSSQINHNNADTPNTSGLTCPVSGKDLTQGKCPVIHSTGKCPVVNQSVLSRIAEVSSLKEQTPPSPESITPLTTSNEEQKSLEIPVTCPVSGKSTDGGGKCPVAHNLEVDNDSDLKERLDSETPQTSNVDEEEDDDLNDDNNNHSHPIVNRTDDKVCPLMYGDNSFLKTLKDQSGHAEDENDKNNNTNDTNDTHDEPETKKRKKTSRSNSNTSNKSNKSNHGNNAKPSTEQKAKVKPEDFKKNPVALMQQFLPKKKILWLFLDRFFEVLYIYMPFVDEVSFREEVRFIFGDRDDEEQDVKIRIRSGVDFALVGTVCILMRLTWNTLPMNNLNKLLGKPAISTKSYAENQESIKILQKPENEIPLELVDCVKHCFSNLKLMRRSSLIIVQCALYLRLYFIYSPEDGDGADGGDSQIFLGMIIQMAISIGLHRDPKNFENFTNERQRHLWRKIWHELISLDIQQSMNLGCPRGLQNYDEFSDTNLPGETGDGLDLKEFANDPRELTVIKNIHVRHNVDNLISKTMNVLLNVNEPAKRYQVDLLIKELQKSIDGFGLQRDKFALPQLGKILINKTKNESLSSSATRALEFRLHVLVNMLIYLLNYILFVHFEPKGATDPQIALIAKNYAQRALDCALEGYRNCTLFFDCGVEYFGPGVDLVLSPLLLLVGHRSIQFMVSLILRSRCGPFMKPNSIENNISNDGLTVNPKNFANNTSENNQGLQNTDSRQEEYKSIFNADVNSGEILSTILLDHMDRFRKLADTLGKKYSYSWRMAKAVSFFITLLRKPINSVKSIVKTEFAENGDLYGNLSKISTQGPSISTDEESVKKSSVSNTLINTHSPAQNNHHNEHGQYTPDRHQQQEEQEQEFQKQYQNNQYHNDRYQLENQYHQQQQQQYQTQQQFYQQQSDVSLQQAPLQTPAQSRSTSFVQQGNNITTPSAYGSTNYATPMERADSFSMGATPTPGPNNGSFSLALNAYNGLNDINPINNVDVDMNDGSFPELVQATESFVNFTDADRSLNDMFGIALNETKTTGLNNGGILSNPNNGMIPDSFLFSDIPGSSTSQTGNGGDNTEFSMMMSGSAWFN